MENSNQTSSPLTLKESRFVTAYLTATTIKEAAVSAGCLSSPSSQGCRVLNRKRVQTAIQTAQQSLQERHGIDHDNLARKLLSAYQEAHGKSDVMGMIRAVRELGLLCGLYDTTEPAKSANSVDFSVMSDRALRELAASE